MSGARILLLGKDGQIGSSLQPRLAKLGSVTSHGRSTCDLGNFERLRDVVRSLQPDLIVNAAAYTDVNKAETDDVDLCYRINAEAPGILAMEAKAIGAWLIHYSTDYVFDGRKTVPYLEEDEPAPLNVYGRSKHAGDCAIVTHSENHTILRIGWIVSPTGRNFAKTVLRRASQQDELKVVVNQIGAPTSADFVAEMTSKVAGKFLTGNAQEKESIKGLFNLAPSGVASRYQFAVELVEEARRQGWPLKPSEALIVPVATNQYPAMVERPENSAFDTDKIRRLLNIEFPLWQSLMAPVVARLSRTPDMD